MTTKCHFTYEFRDNFYTDISIKTFKSIASIVIQSALWYNMINDLDNLYFISYWHF